ncbi:sulfotransferase family 2 domain-containing protein [Paraglaciecola sp.]|uniref:sulfotransferase family 2 domain-containing protein n=1 Tax=Paraglaciecola sp. TaxID=1920173 RepID=UPI0030F392F8
MHRHRCIFIHIPKCAGSSILKALGHTGGRDHVEWRHYQGANPKWFKHYFKFAVCRHPFARLRSVYYYVISGGNQSSNDLALKTLIQAKSNSFESFVENVLNEEFASDNVLFHPQYRYVFNNVGQLMVDNILRFETLDKEWQAMVNTKGLSKSALKLNITNKTEDLIKVKTLILSPTQLHKIQHIYRKDFQLFGYSEEGM